MGVSEENIFQECEEKVKLELKARSIKKVMNDMKFQPQLHYKETKKRIKRNVRRSSHERLPKQMMQSI